MAAAVERERRLQREDLRNVAGGLSGFKLLGGFVVVGNICRMMFRVMNLLKRERERKKEKKKKNLVEKKKKLFLIPRRAFPSYFHDIS